LVPVRTCPKNLRILLANLFPPSQVNLSAWTFPQSCISKEAIGKAPFSTLPSSPTVAHELGLTTADENRKAIFSRVSVLTRADGTGIVGHFGCNIGHAVKKYLLIFFVIAELVGGITVWANQEHLSFRRIEGTEIGVVRGRKNVIVSNLSTNVEGQFSSDMACILDNQIGNCLWLRFKGSFIRQFYLWSQSEQAFFGFWSIFTNESLVLELADLFSNKTSNIYRRSLTSIFQESTYLHFSFHSERGVVFDSSKHNPWTLANFHGVFAELYGLFGHLQSFSHSMPLEASKYHIYKSRDEYTSLNNDGNKLILRQPPTKMLSILVLSASWGLSCLGLGILYRGGRFSATICLGCLFTVLILVHLGMSLLLFNSPLKIFRIFLFDES
jgi:hypothetical protein